MLQAQAKAGRGVNFVSLPREGVMLVKVLSAACNNKTDGDSLDIACQKVVQGLVVQQDIFAP